MNTINILIFSISSFLGLLTVSYIFHLHRVQETIERERNKEKNLPRAVNQESHNGRKIPVMQFDLDGNLIAEYPSINAATRHLLGLSDGTNSAEVDNRKKAISNVCKCKVGYTTAYGYMWCYSRDYSDSYLELMLKRASTSSKRIIYYIYSSEGKFIIDVPTLMDVQKLIAPDLSTSSIHYRIQNKYPVGDYFVSRNKLAASTVHSYYLSGYKVMRKSKQSCCSASPPAA